MPTERKCPHCAELVKAEAKICRYCQRDLPFAEEAAAAAIEVKPKGVCPNCEQIIPLDSLECEKCSATFGPNAAWKIRPLINP
jgi:RNA polymerase subunit RPABC4/transcription elongation factor Spt4